MQCQVCTGEINADTLYREGGIRRGYGFRSLRLRNQQRCPWTYCSGSLVDRQGFWERLCVLYLLLHVMGVKGRIIQSSREGTQPCTLDSSVETIQTCFFQI
jgi:hypothetical protein